MVFHFVQNKLPLVLFEVVALSLAQSTLLVVEALWKTGIVDEQGIFGA